MTGPQRYLEEQRFPGWIKALAVLPLALVSGVCMSALLAGSPTDVLVVALLPMALLLPLVILTFRMRLVTTVDEAALRLRVRPAGRMIPLPAGMKTNDIELSDISSIELRTYNSLRSTEFWGWHVWGLSAAVSGKRYLYGMRPSGLMSLRGVYMCLADGGIVMISSRHPEELMAALDSLRR
jgi:hypothetical protein